MYDWTWKVSRMCGVAIFAVFGWMAKVVIESLPVIKETVSDLFKELKSYASELVNNK